ncbi:MAG: hypothetical protein L3V56_03880 [Candidatus Magnetoovum sp. WYHC-5]|nr:hypothetical protein [Candidatus Magnetoovum sp. WYHC-5]
MKKFISLFVMMTVMLMAYSAFAGEFADLQKKITETREALVTMVNDKAKRGEEQQKMLKTTTEAVNTALAGMKAPAGKDAQFKELTDTWNAFTKTRDEELVPALLAGKDDDAKKLATGIQKERFEKLVSLCGELDK